MSIPPHIASSSQSAAPTDRVHPSPLHPASGVHGPGPVRNPYEGLSLEEVLGERRQPPRRWGLALALFLATCYTTWAVGGQVYMFGVMGILLTHELGHFLQAVRYGVPASPPFFIPFPSLIGTMGAVIVQYDHQGNRKQLFDIGLSGPIAGLIVAIPIAAWGIMIARPVEAGHAALATLHFGDPLLITWLTAWLRPELPYGQELWMNPQLQAGWFGLVLTGLNMMPLGQLDGGHVSYALFSRRAHLLARGVLMAAIVAMVVSNNYSYSLMVMLVLLMGVDHPPTANDELPLGWTRTVIGLASFLIPVLCFTPVLISEA
ncbi:MAG: site-2 protease family protein [Pirellulales bacterium]|nr:site-2 protease family protein [Pirellulales bacterium]